jgi:hypothetical protein
MGVFARNFKTKSGVEENINFFSQQSIKYMLTLRITARTIMVVIGLELIGIAIGPFTD